MSYGCLSVAAFDSWYNGQVCNFLVGLFFLELVDKFGVAPVYAGFGGISLLTAAFAYYFTVETKGRSLEEIEMSINSSLQSRSRQ